MVSRDQVRHRSRVVSENQAEQVSKYKFEICVSRGYWVFHESVPLLVQSSTPSGKLFIYGCVILLPCFRPPFSLGGNFWILSQFFVLPTTKTIERIITISHKDNNMSLMDDSLLLTIPIGSIRDGSTHTEEASTVSIDAWLAKPSLITGDDASLFSDIAQEEENDEFAFERLNESPSSEEMSVADQDGHNVHPQFTTSTSIEQQQTEDDDEDDVLMNLLLQEVAQEPEPLFPSSTNSIVSSYHHRFPSSSYIPLATMMSSSIQWGEHDVPLGRCQEVREHVGNIRYRELVEQHRPAYQKTTRKSDKNVISTMIYNIIRTNGGRFLDRKKSKDPKKMFASTNEWYEIPQDKAIAKIAQSLRNGIRPVKKEKSLLQQQQQKQQQQQIKEKSISSIMATAPKQTSTHSPRRVSFQEKEDPRQYPAVESCCGSSYRPSSKPPHFYYGAPGHHHYSYPAAPSWHHHHSHQQQYHPTQQPFRR